MHPTTITLRDYFAGHALAGILAAHAGAGIALPENEDAAEDAYEYADALLAARQPKPDAAHEQAESGDGETD